MRATTRVIKNNKNNTKLNRIELADGTIVTKSLDGQLSQLLSDEIGVLFHRRRDFFCSLARGVAHIWEWQQVSVDWNTHRVTTSMRQDPVNLFPIRACAWFFVCVCAEQYLSCEAESTHPSFDLLHHECISIEEISPNQNTPT